jgi:hypothetical protein
MRKWAKKLKIELVPVDLRLLDYTTHPRAAGACRPSLECERLDLQNFQIAVNHSNKYKQATKTASMATPNQQNGSATAPIDLAN